MDDKDIVNIFIENGFQLSNDSLEIIKTNPEHFLEEIKKIKPRPFIISKKIAEEIKEPQKKTEFIEKDISIKNKTDINKLNNFYVSHYKKIKKNITENYSFENLISISNITKEKKFSVIGMVREMGEKNILLEDISGETRIYFEDKKKIDDVGLDDVLGLSCLFKNNKIYAEKKHPPITKTSREVKKTKNKISLGIFNENYVEKNDYSVIFSRKNQTKNKNSIFVDKNSRPATFSIENIDILILPETDKTKKNITKIIDQLVVWDVDKINNLDFSEPPDVIITKSKDNFCFNYKGTTIVSVNDPNTYYTIDLNTREFSEFKLNS